MNKSITKNYIYNLIYQVLIIIMPIITTPYLARTLGPVGTGTYSYTISIVTYFILFGSLGLAMYGQREIAYVQDDAKKRSKIFYELIILRCVTMVAAGIIFYLIYGISGEYATYYRILLLEMLANCVDISWFFQGIENFKKTATRNIIVKILSVICIFIFIKNENDVAKYLLIYVLTTLFGNICLWLDVKKYICKISIKDIKPLHQLKDTFSLFIPQVAIQVYTVLDKTMIGAILGDMSEVGYYEQTQKIVKILLTIITSLGTVMMPRIAKCFSENDHKKIQSYMYKSFNFVFLLSFPLIFGIIAVANNFVPLFFGQGYDKVIILMKVMSIIIVFMGLSSVTGVQYLLPIKKQKQYTISVVCGAIINAILNFILINYCKSLGAVIATLVSECTVAVVQFYFIRKEFSIVKVLKNSFRYIIASIIMFIIVYVIGNVITNTKIALITQVFSGMVIYLIILIVLKDPFLKELKQRILKR